VNLEPGQSAQAVADSVDGGICSDSHSCTLGALAIGVGDSGSVRVSFPEGQPLTLDFPSCAEFLVSTGAGKPTSPALDTHYYYLNCQAAPLIPAGGAVTFAMEIPVPPGAGAAKYGWELQGTGVETGGVTTVGAG
jgi:hypothetical protein